MGIKDQVTRKPAWTVTAAAAALGIAGITGMALASGSGNDSDLPETIRLRDRTPVVEATVPAPISDVNVVSGPIEKFSSAASSVDSPLDSQAGSGGNGGAWDSVSTDSPDTGATSGAGADVSVNTVDSPDAVASVASYDSPSVASPASVSVDSPS